MKNNKGQSLMDVIFSITTVVLVLTGIVALAVNTSKTRRVIFERQKATELAQKIIEREVNSVKNDTSGFWETKKTNTQSSSVDDFPGYIYGVVYSYGADGNSCNVKIIVNWGVGQSLSVQRFFSKKGL